MGWGSLRAAFAESSSAAFCNPRSHSLKERMICGWDRLLLDDRTIEQNRTERVWSLGDLVS